MSVFVLSAVTVIVVASLTTCNCDDCPQSSSKVVDEKGEWCHVIAHFAPWEEKAIRNKHEAAADKCAQLTLDSLKWKLPRADTMQKNIALTKFLHGHPADSYIWIGLRRQSATSETTSVLEWADPKYWYWTDDKTSLLEMQGRNLNIFWMGKFVRVGQECAVATVGNVEGKTSLQWRTYPCVANRTNASAATNWFNVKVPVVVCETKAKSPFEWWFYAICAGLIVISLAAAIGACVTLSKYLSARNKRRRPGDRDRGRDKPKQGRTWREYFQGKKKHVPYVVKYPNSSYIDLGPIRGYKQKPKFIGTPKFIEMHQNLSKRGSIMEEEEPYSNVQPPGSKPAKHKHLPARIIVSQKDQKSQSKTSRMKSTAAAAVSTAVSAAVTAKKR